MAIEYQAPAFTVGRKLETEFRIDLHSPTTGGVWHFLVYGSRESAANLAALDYAREQDPDDPSWRTLSILSEPSSAELMRFELMSEDEMDAEEEDDWEDD